MLMVRRDMLFARISAHCFSAAAHSRLTPPARSVFHRCHAQDAPSLFVPPLLGASLIKMIRFFVERCPLFVIFFSLSRLR